MVVVVVVVVLAVVVVAVVVIVVVVLFVVVALDVFELQVCARKKHQDWYVAPLGWIVICSTLLNYSAEHSFTPCNDTCTD